MSNELTPLTLQLFQTTKQARKEFVQKLVNEIEEGNIDPLTIHLQVKAIEDLLLKLTSTDEKKNKACLGIALRYKKLLLEEADKYGKKFEYGNAEFQQKEAGVKYDFSECGDVQLMSLYDELEVLKEKIKKREDFLKAIDGSLNQVDESTGEVCTLYPPSKSSTTILQVTLK
jgi:hypothetical protein